MPSKPEKSLNFSPPITSQSSFSVIISKEGEICTIFSDLEASYGWQTACMSDCCLGAMFLSRLTN